MKLGSICVMGVAAVVVVLTCVPLLGDSYHCIIVSSGAQIDAGTGSIQNVGQNAIGRSSGAGVILHAGGIHCYSVGTTCVLGDVDGNGLINGADIDNYVRVVVTGVGTAQEVCAANISIDAFSLLLLGS